MKRKPLTPTQLADRWWRKKGALPFKHERDAFLAGYRAALRRRKSDSRS